MVVATSIREDRHNVIVQAHTACDQLRGRQGLSQEQQVERIQKAGRALAQATTALAALLEKAQSRDFAAHQAAKHGESAGNSGPLFGNSDDDEDEDEETADAINLGSLDEDEEAQY